MNTLVAVWILILSSNGTNGGQAPATVPMASEEACLSAAHSLTGMFADYRGARCVNTQTGKVIK